MQKLTKKHTYTNEQVRRSKKKPFHVHYCHSRFDRRGMAATKRIPSQDMRYLVTMNGNPPFLTKWFEYENHWDDGKGIVIYDLQTLTYTTDGTTWHPIETDQL